jgi:hypothetical protein
MRAFLALPLAAALLLAGCAGDDGSAAIANCTSQLVSMLKTNAPDATDDQIATFTANATKTCQADRKKDPAGFDKQYA